MSTNAVLSSNVNALLAEALEWRLMQLLFQCPSGSWREAVASVAQEVQRSELREAAVAAVQGADEGAYHSIFGPGGPAPAREASYQRTVQLGYLIAEIHAFYEAFGYNRTEGADAVYPPDHISVESGFMGFMKLKQAYALMQADRKSTRLNSSHT